MLGLSVFKGADSSLVLTPLLTSDLFFMATPLPPHTAKGENFELTSFEKRSKHYTIVNYHI